jgi:putative ABC transport system permease protein
MFRHFLKVAYRNLLRRKVYTFINITGLAVGMACCLLIAFYVLNELSYDKYHPKADRIYRVTQTFRNAHEGETLPPPEPQDYQVWGCAPVGPALAADFPAIEKVVRFMSPLSLLLEHGDKRFQEDNLVCMDSTAFDVFGWKMLEGDPHTALTGVNSIVLTKKLADKYFGTTNAVGKTLKFENSGTFMVTGVMEDVPANSQFSFAALISMATYNSWRPEIFGAWGYVDFYTYLLLKPGTSVRTIEARVPEFLKKNHDDKGYTIAFERFTDAYLHSKASRQPGATGNLMNVYIFSIVGIFILVLACINFMNLSTARSMERAREVGVRKVLGAHQQGLIRQFLSESVLLSIFAAIIGILLARLAVPLISELSGKPFIKDSFFSWYLLLLIFGFAIVIGLLSGIYPALFLSAFRPIRVLKSSVNAPSGGVNIRKVLVVFQFTLSMSLIAATGIVYAQLKYLRSHDLGFSSDQMLVIDFGEDGAVQGKIETIKNIFRQQPSVLSASASRAVPGEFLPNAYTEIQSPEGPMVGEAPLLYEIDNDFVSNFNLKMVAGRSYSREFPADSANALMLNEAAARMFGYVNPADIVGKKFSQWGREGRVVGVVKDFNFRSLHRAIEPLALRYADRGSYGRLSLHIQSSNMQATIARLKKIWEDVAPQRPFLYSFLDESFNRQYQADVHFGGLFTLFSALAIFVACLGLFGLATYSAELRTREIGIRKVLGSSVSGIITLMSKDFIRLVLVSIVIAVPISWYVMSRWLDDFAYRITIGAGIFIESGLLLVIVALTTISWQAIRAALANPVQALRAE